MARVKWSAAEDEYIIETYNRGNSAFITYRKQSFLMNKIFHGDSHVRSESSIRRREKKLLTQGNTLNSLLDGAPSIHERDGV